MRQGPAASRYPLVLLLLFLGFFAVMAIEPKHRFDWFLESILVAIFVPLLVATHNRFPLSNVSYTLIAVFLGLHVVGSHWTYAEVPLDWESFGFERNHYDRVVHFSFGLLLAYPIREVFLRVAKAEGFWGYYLPLDVTLAFSAVYEVVEWAVAEVVAPDAGAAFLGSQGDPFDAVKDMALAGAGAFLAMLVTAWINSKLDVGFAAGIRRSLAVKDLFPHGERKLLEIMRRREKRFRR